MCHWFQKIQWVNSSADTLNLKIKSLQSSQPLKNEFISEVWLFYKCTQSKVQRCVEAKLQFWSFISLNSLNPWNQFIAIYIVFVYVTKMPMYVDSFHSMDILNTVIYIFMQQMLICKGIATVKEIKEKSFVSIQFFLSFFEKYEYNPSIPDIASTSMNETNSKCHSYFNIISNSTLFKPLIFH